MRPIVDIGWLAEHRDDVVLVDVRWYLDGRSGRAAYEAGHVPGAVYVELNQWLAGEASAQVGRHPLPSPAVFAHGMAVNGISDDSVVVAYDDAGGVIAARLVWMLRATGHEAALLDGGLAAYAGELATGEAIVSAEGVFAVREWPAERLATIDEASGSGSVIIDARDRGRYRGEADPVDPRSGHIPGARNVPCRENLDPSGALLPLEVVRQRFEEVGVHEGTSVISYCGSGVTACHNLLVMEQLGLGPGRLYPGSWSQYSHDATRPVATGDQPG